MASGTEKDLYAALGLGRTATADEIKKAYRKLARKHHPDVNPGNRESEERFKAISEANDILGDPDKRKLYDEFGMSGVQGGFDPENARQAREYARGGWQQRASGGGSFESGGYAGFEDLFGDLFGEGGASRPGQKQAGHDLETEIEIGLLDAVRGTSTALSFERPETCDVCKGEGSDLSAATTCTDCNGSGRARVAKGPLAFTRPCPRCGGHGKLNIRPCGACSGQGTRARSERLQVKIPAGVDTGSKIRLEGKGASGTGGARTGDLFIRVRVRPHPLLERKEDDLYMDVPLSVSEAVAGGSIEIPTPDGSSVRVRVTAGTQSGKKLRIKGHGVPHLKGGGRGDLYLRLMVQVPDQLSEPVTAAAAALDAGYSRPPRDGFQL